MQKLECCIWFLTARMTDVENIELDYCRKCNGHNTNCQKYLKSECKQWEYDYYEKKQNRKLN